MLLCLSSGASPRYLQDILRALSKPAGSELRFRYELQIVAASLHKDMSNLAGEDVCIAYLDRRNPAIAPAVIPVRSGTVIAAEILGDFCVLDFQLGDYLVARDMTNFERELRSAVGTLPAWDTSTPSKLTGMFCDRIQRDLTSLVESSDVADWQQICKTLASRDDFKDELFFYRVAGLFNLDSDAAIPVKEGIYTVPADALLELRLLHYAPSIDARKTSINDRGWLIAENSENEVTFVTSYRLAIDSAYDLKAIRMRTASVTHDTDGMITLNRRLPAIGGSSPEPIWDFDLPIRVKRNLRRMLWQGALIGVLVALQGLVGIWNNPQIADKVTPSLLVIIFGLATGYVAIFNLRKP